jgi:hypothetical protein
MAKVHPGFTLAQLVETTANELRAVRAGASDDAVIKFTGCELELAVTVSAESGGGIRFWLVELSGKGKAETVSKVKLKFGPLDDAIIAALAKRSGRKGPKARRN